jgi:hypothetical protein
MQKIEEINGVARIEGGVPKSATPHAKAFVTAST